MQFMVMAAQFAVFIVGGIVGGAIAIYFGVDSAFALVVLGSGFIASYGVTILSVRILERINRRLLRQQSGDDFGP